MRHIARLLASTCAASLLPAISIGASPGWIDAGDPALRDAVERLVDERVLELPVMSWPISEADLRRAISGSRLEGRIRPADEIYAARIEMSLAQAARREASIAAGQPTDLRSFDDAPRETAELGVRASWRGSERWAGVLRLRAVLDPADGQSLRPDGSYLATRAGNWLVSAGWQDRWWGSGFDGSLQLSSNARPVFALSLDRETSRPFETRWLRWLGPWTFGTFMGGLENHRPDSNHALLWGARAAVRPLPGLEFSVTRNAQFCGDKPPCSPKAFWNVLVGNDNVGESVSAQDEPGNQLATYEARWGGHLFSLPVSLHFQNTGETIDNKFPRPLRTLTLVNASTWGTLASGMGWRGHFEFSSTTCADFDDAQSFDCGYENGVFSAGYRYRGRPLGHSTDSDSRQFSLGLQLQDGMRYWSAGLRRVEINRAGNVPQPFHSLAPAGPQLWWVGEGSLRQPFAGGTLELALGVEHRHVRLTGDTDVEPTGYARWTHAF